MRPSSEIVRALNGSATDATWSRACDVAQDIRHLSTLVVERAFLGFEDDQGGALGGVGEVLVEQLHGACALAAR